MANFDSGISRDPYHRRGKAVFAINFDLLKLKVDGKDIPIDTVQGIYPDTETVYVFEKTDAKTFKLNSDGGPVVNAINGTVEVEGTPRSCGCNMVKFQVHRWWEKKLIG